MDEIQTEVKYSAENARLTKTINAFGKKYELEYLYTVKWQNCGFPRDVYQVTNGAESVKSYGMDSPTIEFEFGTDRIVCIKNLYIRKADDREYTEDELKNIAEGYLSELCDISAYEETEVNNISDTYYGFRYYNTYCGIHLYDSSYISITKNGEITSINTSWNNEKQKFIDMGIEIDEKEHKIAIERKLDYIYGEGEYTYTVDSRYLGINADGEPFMYCMLDVKKRFDGQLCELYIFE
jgi:hypothetical protein